MVPFDTSQPFIAILRNKAKLIEALDPLRWHHGYLIRSMHMSCSEHHAHLMMASLSFNYDPAFDLHFDLKPLRHFLTKILFLIFTHAYILQTNKLAEECNQSVQRHPLGSTSKEIGGFFPAGLKMLGHFGANWHSKYFQHISIVVIVMKALQLLSTNPRKCYINV